MMDQAMRSTDGHRQLNAKRPLRNSMATAAQRNTHRAPVPPYVITALCHSCVAVARRIPGQEDPSSSCQIHRAEPFAC